MLVKSFGIIDVIAGFILVFETSINFPNTIFIVFGIALFAKSSLGFLRDFGSWIDFLAGSFFLILIVIQVHWLILAIISLLLIQKGVFSFL